MVRETDLLSFDRYELMLIEAALSPSTVSADSESLSSSPSKELCLKVGSALEETIASSKPDYRTSLNLTEQECWILQERINIFASSGPRVDSGISIKRELYRALLEYAFDSSVGNEVQILSQELERKLHRVVLSEPSVVEEEAGSGP